MHQIQDLLNRTPEVNPKINNEKHGNRKHGLSKSRIYKIWMCMKYRCDVGGNRFSSYKGKGITYDPRWKKFDEFYKDMKLGYKDSLSLDRIDNMGNYYKNNCRWATRIQQGRNMDFNVIMKGKTLKEWSGILGIRYITLYVRLIKLKWSAEEIISTPLRRQNGKYRQSATKL